MKFEKLDKYMNEAEVDFVIERDKIASKLSKLPMMHSKWMRYYYTEKLILEKKVSDLKRLYKTKFEFYMTGYQYAVKESKAHHFVEGDDEYAKLALQVSAYQYLVNYLEEQVKRCSSLNFIYKNIIEWEKFKVGA